MYYKDVDSEDKFVNFLESRFIERNHINMILNSNASRNEDRFYAILPSWSKYNHLIKNKNTISSWKITDMLSVKLKLYEIVSDDDGDLWDNARLFHACSIHTGKPILPSFATHFQSDFIFEELDNVDSILTWTMGYLSEYKDVKKYLKDHHKIEFKSILKQNSVDIEYNQQQYSLSIKADKYFIFYQLLIFSQKGISYYLLEDNEKLRDSIPLLSGTLLLGNININRWVFYSLNGCKAYGKPSICSTDGYIFSIY